jgi:hypothetical protein
MHEQIVHGFDVFGEESHGGSFLLREHDSAGRFVAAMLRCSVADDR